MRLALVVLMVLAANAAADPCKGVATPLRNIMREMRALSARSSAAIATCTFHGPDAKLAASLRTEATKVAKHEEAIAKWEKCTVHPSGQNAPAMISIRDQWAGDRLTAALTLCDPKQNTTGKGTDECKELETFVQTFTSIMEGAAKQADELAAVCAVKGANDKGLTTLATSTRPKLDGLMKGAPKSATCKPINLDLAKMAEAEGEAAGKIIGAGFAMCSAKARAKAAELAKAGTVSVEDMQKGLAPLSGDYIEQIFGK